MELSSISKQHDIRLQQQGIQNHRITESQNHRTTESQNHRITEIAMPKKTVYPQEKDMGLFVSRLPFLFIGLNRFIAYSVRVTVKVGDL